ncbi:hypothetical protein BC826DRAFT_309091 [Russula brevipes]|nr:hypothetical protein BC826DRAFT_309091 [Russula brevipes]
MNPHNHIQRPIRHLVSSLFAGIPQCLFPTIFGSSILIDDLAGGFAVGEPTIYPLWRPEGEDPSGGSVVWELAAHPQEGSGADRGQRRAIIHALPDNVLLDMFDFYLEDTKRTEEWHTLVHVCPRWRYLVFAAPRRLRLRLLCTAKRRVGKMLDAFPALPIQIWCGDGSRSLVRGADNIVAALQQNGRVCKIDLQGVPSSVLEKIMAAMHCPFPELTDLRLSSTDGGSEPVVPHSFLGGSAAHLRELDLTRVVFPQVGDLLLSASRLVTLCLWDIPSAGQISPEAMVACLSSLTSLESLYLGFRYFRSRPDQKSRRPPPPTRTILPALTRLLFKGGCEYLEDLVARISAPLLYNFSSSFFNELVFDTRQLLQFISEAEQLRSLNRADVSFTATSSRSNFTLTRGQFTTKSSR